MNNIQKELLIKRFQTTMIGSLHEFEKSFGYLWGYDKPFEELTSKEIEFNDIWENTRNKILNNGNNQMRKAINDFSKNNELHKKYKYNFTKKERDL